MAVSLKTDLRFPESGQHGHGSRIIHFTYQIYVEPKGSHLLEEESWKEDFSLQIEEN